MAPIVAPTNHVGCAQPLVEQQSAADGQDRRPGHRQGRGQGVDGDVEGDGKAAVFDDKMHEHDAVLAQGLKGQVLPEAEGEEGDDAEDERRRWEEPRQVGARGGPCRSFGHLPGPDPPCRRRGQPVTTSL